MRIVRIVPSLVPLYGGPAVHVAVTSPELARRGHDVLVITGDPPGTNGAQDEFEVVDAGPRRTRYGYARRLSDAVERATTGADVLLVHGLWEHTTHAALRLGRRRPPTVVMPHGMLDPWIVGRTPSHRMLRSAQGRLLDFRMIERAQAVLFTSEREAAAAATTLGNRSFSGTVIRYGTADPRGDHVEPKRDREASGAVTFGMFGRLHPKKRADLLVAALGQPGLEHAHARFIGPPSAEADRIRALVDAGGLADRATVEPPVVGAARFEMLKQLDWLVLPSMQENFAQVVSEALSVGTPVIVSDAVNTSPIIEAGRAGFVCDTDVASLATSMRAAASSGDAPGWSSRARALYEAHFTIDGCVDDLEGSLTTVARVR